MIDYHKQLVTALNTVLPTHYEMTQYCSPHSLRNDADQQDGDALYQLYGG